MKTTNWPTAVVTLLFCVDKNVYFSSQVGYSITSQLLSDREKYPLFARTVETTDIHNPVLMKILQEFNWKRVATIAQNSEFVTPVSIIKVFIWTC